MMLLKDCRIGKSLIINVVYLCKKTQKNYQAKNHLIVSKKLASKSQLSLRHYAIPSNLGILWSCSEKDRQIDLLPHCGL